MGDRAQQVQDIENLLLRVEGMASHEVIVNLIPAQGLLVVLNVRKRAKQDGHIARPNRP